VNALNKGINNPGDQKGYLEEGEESITLFKHEYFTKFNLNFLTKSKGKQVRLSGYTICDTISTEQYFNKKYDSAEIELSKESVFLEIYLEKQ